MFYGMAAGASVQNPRSDPWSVIPGRPWRRPQGSVRPHLHRGLTMLRAFWERPIRRFTRGRQTARKAVWHGRFRPNLETLGDRIVPAVTSLFISSTGVLTVFGDNAANTITISRDTDGRI